MSDQQRNRDDAPLDMQDAFERSEFYFNGESPAERSHNWKVWVAAWKAARRPVRTFVKDIITGVAAQYRDQGMKKIASEILSLIDAEHAAPAPAPSPADERAAFEWPLLPLLPETVITTADGEAVFTAHQMQGYANAYGEMVRARAASASATGAEGADALAHEVWSAAQRAPGEGIEDAVQRIAAILSRSPAMAAEAVAIPAGWKAMPPSATMAMRMAMAKAAAEYMQRTGGNSPDAIYEAAFAAAPQPAQADARVGLTEARATIMDACQSISRSADALKECHTVDGDWGDDLDAKAFYDAELQLLARLTALLDHPGQPEPRAEVTEEQPSLTNPLTPYGMLVRALRIVSGTLLYDMAKSMSLSPATLSAIEVGRRPATYAEACGAADFFASRGIPGTLQALECAVDAARRTTPDRECEWKCDDIDNGIWESSCGESWSFIDGGPIENRMLFCHRCGVKLKTSPTSDHGGA